MLQEDTELTISKQMYNDDKCIIIKIRKGKRQILAKMSLEEFTEAITGLVINPEVTIKGDWK